MRWCKGAHRGHKRKGPDIHNLTFAVKIIRKFTFPKNGELIKPCDTISLNANLAKYREGREAALRRFDGARFLLDWPAPRENKYYIACKKCTQCKIQIRFKFL